MRSIKFWEEKGQALTEFALVLSFILVPVTIAILDGGMLFFKYVMIAGTAREGARAGSIYQHPDVVPEGETSCGFVATVDTTGIVNRRAYILQVIETHLGPLVSFSDITVDVTYDHDHDGVFNENPDDTFPEILDDVCNPYREGDAVQVRITHQHSPILGLVIGISSLTLSADAVMVIEPGGASPNV